MFGVNDLDGTVVEEKISHAAGVDTGQELSKAELVRVDPRRRPRPGGARHAVQRGAALRWRRRLTARRPRRARLRGPAAPARGPVRVGRIEFVNCFPLYHHFARELAARGVTATIVEGYPSVLNEMLVSGAIDVALPSSIAFARDAAELTLLPQVSISSFGAVDSVQLFTRVPLNDVRRIALTEKSATSICLLKVLCREWGLEPEFAPRRGSLAEVLADFDGLLLIGDEALYVLRAEVYPYHYDLGAEWQQVTGLPMVFAVCAARREFTAARPAAAAAVGAALLASRDRLRRAPGRDGRGRGAALRLQPALPRGVLRQAQVRLHAGVPRRSATSSTGAPRPSASWTWSRTWRRWQASPERIIPLTRLTRGGRVGAG